MYPRVPFLLFCGWSLPKTDAQLHTVMFKSPHVIVRLITRSNKCICHAKESKFLVCYCVALH